MVTTLEGPVEEEEERGGDQWGLRLEDLPPEVWQMVFDWLKSKDLIRLTHVSNWWRSRVLGLLRHYRLRSSSADQVRSVLVFSWLQQQLHHQSSSSSPTQESPKKKMKQHKKLKKKRKDGKTKDVEEDEEEAMMETMMRAGGEATLALLMERMTDECPRLRSLDLSLIRGPAAHLADAIARLPPTLTSLTLAYCGLEGAANLDRLARVTPELTRLDVSHCARLDNSALAALPPGLVALKVNGCRQLGSAVFAALPPTLAELDLRNCDGVTWSAPGADLPRGLKTLKLSLRRGDPIERRWGAAVLGHHSYHQVRKRSALADLPPGLVRLDLSDCSAAFGYDLALLPRGLQQLGLKRCNAIRASGTPTSLLLSHCSALC